MRDSVLIGPGGHPMRPKPLLRTTLGQILRHARREQGRTLADVARAARVSMPYLSELERGRKEASSEVLAAVCEALRIELSDLLAEAGRHLADERARRALIEERARRRRERTGELPRKRRERAGDLPLDVGERAAELPPVTRLDVPVVVPLDAVRSRRAAPAGRGPGDAAGRGRGDAQALAA
jgi:transcriptional regulator with XRE-family HTH domain